MEQPTQPQTEETLLDRTEKVVAELKAQNDRKEALIKEEQRIRANALLGGRTDAGQMQPQRTESDIKKDGALEFFKGSEIERAIRKH